MLGRGDGVSRSGGGGRAALRVLSVLALVAANSLGSVSSVDGGTNRAEATTVRASSAPETTSTTRRAAVSGSAPHIMLIVEENEAYSSIIGNTAQAQYLNTLAGTYASATNWYAVQHNSPHDYLDLIVGSDLNLPTGKPYSNTTLVDELHSSSIPWRAYMETMPSNCFKGPSSNPEYDPNHNPFVNFNNYTASGSSGWCSSGNLGSEGVFPYPGSSGMVSALDAGNAPDFVFLVPNDCDEMHGVAGGGTPCSGDSPDALISAGSSWLQSNLPPVLASSWFQQNGVVIITWDEGVGSKGCCGLSSAGGQIATIVVASGNKGSGAFTPTGDHYGTLRAIEEQYGVAKLGGSNSTAGGDLTGAFGGSTPTTGSISGTVADSVTGTGISGATVSSTAGNTITSSSGSYTLAGVSAGTYTVSASATGLTTLSASVKVTAGNNTTQNFALVPTGGGGSISGTAVDTQNPTHPVANATISYSGASTTTTTNASGTYTLSGVAAGTYTVTATLAGFTTQTDSSVKVTAGTATTGVNFSMPATSGITGTVTDTEVPAQPVFGATVTYTGTGGTAGSGTTMTNASGVYTFTGVPPGTYSVGVTDSGFTPPTPKSATVTAGKTASMSFIITAGSGISGVVSDTESPAQPVAAATVTYTGTGGTPGHGTTATNASGIYIFGGAPPGTYSVSVTDTGFTTPTAKSVTVIAGNTASANFTMAATSSITGTVSDTQNPPQPIVGATVTYTGTNGTPGHGSMSTVTGGAYNFAGVPAGSYSVSVTDNGFTVPTSKNVTVTAGAAASASFSMTSTSSITGTVKDTQTPAQPIVGATVTYTGTGGTPGQGTTSTNATGAYTFAGVPAGSYSVSVTDPPFTASTPKSVTVTAGASTSANFTMAATSSISGTVTDSESPAQPVAGAMVTYTGTGGTPGHGTTNTDASGAYNFAGVPPGTYTVNASEAGFNSSGARSVTVTTGLAASAIFTLTATSRITGTLTNSDGSAPASVNVVYTGIDGSTGSGSVTTTSGTYTFTGVPPGTYTVSATELGFISPASQTVSVSTGGTATANFLMTAVGSITGTVTDATNGGVALPNATVTYTGPGGSGTTNTSDSAGEYTLPGLPDGTYSVTASDVSTDGNYQPQTFTVTVIGTVETMQPFALTVGTDGSIAGTVIDAQTSQPVSGAVVSDGTDPPVSTDPSGNYVIEGVTATTYPVTVTLPNYMIGSQSVTVAAGANTQQNFALVEDGTISGTVTDAQTHTPIVGAGVTCALCPVTSAVTDGFGDYSFTNVPPGPGYAVSVTEPGYTGQTVGSLTVSPGAPAAASFALASAYSVPETFGAANGGATASTTLTALPASATGAGDLLVATIKLRVLSGVVTVAGVTDSAGNIWTQGPAVAEGGGFSDEEIWYAVNATSVSGTQANPGVTVTTNIAAAISFTVLDVAGASALGQSATGFGTGSTPQPSVATTTTTAQANEIVIGDLGWNGAATMSGDTFAPAASPVLLAVQSSTVTNLKTAEQAGYQIAHSTSTWTFSGTLSANVAWTGLIATFR